MHRQLPRTRACTLLAAVALGAVVCSSSDADKAGGTMAKVAARAYDTVGRDSFQALLGLLLIDNQMLERRGPEATWRARCW